MQLTLAELDHRFATALQRQDLAAAHEAAADLRYRFPTSEKGWIYGSMTCLMAGDPATGRVLVAEFLSRHPATVSALLQRAECELALGQRAAALVSAQSARAIASEDTAALDAIGVFLTHAAAHRDALAVYEQALAIKPSDASLLLGRAVLSRYLGNFAQARLDYDAILAQAPHHADALKGRADLARQAPRPEEIGDLTAALAEPGVSPADAVSLHFALGKAHEDAGDHATSWRHVVAGNDLQRSHMRYDPAVDAAVVDGLIEAFPTRLPTVATASAEAPIFIVGLPRTGTTLVERILSSHSTVHAGGELPALSESLSRLVGEKRALSELDWLGFVAALPHVDPQQLATVYLQRVQSWRGSKPRFTDKQLTNYYYCGLILAAFPNARIIHVTRHPLATAHAIYKTLFPRTHPYAYRLEEIAEYYVGYQRLMNHWTRLYPDAIHEIAYEDIVGAQEPTTRRLLEACGLSFEDACLQFQDNAAAATTASFAQVRSPLYDSSVALWRHHETALTPVRQRLAMAGIIVD
jgi:tetratricopeptide (TPR) repeat protein